MGACWFWSDMMMYCTKENLNFGTPERIRTSDLLLQRQKLPFFPFPLFSRLLRIFKDLGNLLSTRGFDTVRLLL